MATPTAVGVRPLYTATYRVATPTAAVYNRCCSHGAWRHHIAAPHTVTHITLHRVDTTHSIMYTDSRWSERHRKEHHHA
nr:MAG TPA: hypothetical protein [Caudoviricetes sp.]